MDNEHDEYTPRDQSKGFVWIKIMTNLPDDPKYMRLSDLAKSVYFEAYIWAGRSDAGGLILAGDDPATIQDVCYLMRKQEETITKALDELQRAGLINLDNDQVIVCRFASEQGPAMAEKRKEWVKRQRKKRALARGEIWSEQDKNNDPGTESEKEKREKKEKDSDKVKELKIKTKRVTSMSQESHERVTRDTQVNEEIDDFAGRILQLWQELTGKSFNSNNGFKGMVQDWHNQGVTMQHVQNVMLKYRDIAETPMYLKDAVLELRSKDTDVQEKIQLQKFRDLYNKTNGGDQ